MTPITQTSEWKALQDHYDHVERAHLRDLFRDDPGRGEKMTLEVDGIYLDYSKNRLVDATVELLVALAGRASLRERIDAMFAGEKINVTEQRAVLHVALRAPEGEHIAVDGTDVVPEVHAVLRKMSAFSDRVRSGEHTGHTGRRIRNVRCA